MHVLDTHERKTLNFIPDAFPDLIICQHLEGTGCQLAENNCPYLNNWKDAQKHCTGYKARGIQPLEVGDWLSYEGWQGVNVNNTPHTNAIHGNLVELKIGPDFGIHTEQLKRFQDELYRMRVWQAKNPHVDLHAVWKPKPFPVILDPKIPTDNSLIRRVFKKFIRFVKDMVYNFITLRKQEKLFYHKCQQYYVWGHIVDSEKELIQLLKDLDQPKSYQRDQVYLKRTHEATFLARLFRQIHGVSSEMAVVLSEEISRWLDKPSVVNMMLSVGIYDQPVKIHGDIKGVIIDTVGRKKDGTPKKLALKIIKLLEEGE